MGLIDSPDTWIKTMENASLTASPRQLRMLFVSILAFNENMLEADSLFDAFKLALAQDFIRRNIEEKKAIDMALYCINKRLSYQGFTNGSFKLPMPFISDADMEQYYAATSHSLQDHTKIADDNIKILSAEQRSIFDKVQKAYEKMADPNTVKEEIQHLFFIDGFGGSGKTFLINTLIHYYRGKEINIKAVSWTGISASLMCDGVTAHSAFKLPLKFNPQSVCNIKSGSKEANILKAVKIIIWDEITVTLGAALNCVDLLLQDLMGNELPFGGKVMIVAGDFRQCLPIISSHNPFSIINASVLNSRHWTKFVKCKLTINQRLDAGQQEFAAWQLQVGNGELNDYNVDNNLTGPQQAGVVPNALSEGRKVKFTQENLVDLDTCIEREIFGDSFTIADQERISEYCILTPLNKDVREINAKVLNKLQGEEARTYYSSNKVVIDDNEGHDELDELLEISPDVIQSMNPSGVALHQLTMKVGCFCLVMKNLSTKDGIVNGTRVVVKEMTDNYILVEILLGQHKGEQSFIPRVVMSANINSGLKLIRVQFPLQLCYCMTINKSQGQTFGTVGLLLIQRVFTHGQLYVAVSRCKNKENFKVWIQNSKYQGQLPPTMHTYATNIVYTQVFERV
jgi:hypothetical protein